MDATDKPCPISVNTLSSNDNKLKQSAGQMLILLKILPFLIDTVGENEYTKMLLKLLEIVKMFTYYCSFNSLKANASNRATPKTFQMNNFFQM